MDKPDSSLIPIPEKKLVCVEYPGRVVNVTRALETLGGVETVTKATNTSNQRLPLHFRPDDIYSKPVFGNKYSTTNMLLKVTKKTEHSPGNSESESSSSTADEYSCEVVGVVDSTFKFEGMCDYQFLPMKSTTDGAYTSVLKDLVPDTIEDTSFLEKDPGQPLFVVPGSFARADIPGNYLYQNKRVGYNPLLEENLIGKRRKKRPGNAYIVPFDIETIPSEPQEEAFQSCERLSLQDEVEQIRKLLQERPMYTRLALAVCSKLPMNLLKTILPAVAYYFISGPWRTCWCRLGLDPRTDSSCRMYQTVDFRMRKNVLTKAKMLMQPNTMRGLINVPAKQMRRDRKGASVPSDIGETGESTISQNAPTDTNHLLIDGVLPAHYHMCYQFCDLHARTLRDIIANAEVNRKCDPRFGWWSPGMCDTLRNEMSRIVEATALKILKEESKESEVGDMEAEGGENDEDSYDEDDLESDNEEETELLDYLEPMDT